MSVTSKAWMSALAALRDRRRGVEIRAQLSVRETPPTIVASDVPSLEKNIPTNPPPDSDPALGASGKRESALAPATPIRFERLRLVGRVFDGEKQTPIADALVRHRILRPRHEARLRGGALGDERLFRAHRRWRDARLRLRKRGATASTPRLGSIRSH